MQKYFEFYALVFFSASSSYFTHYNANTKTVMKDGTVERERKNFLKWIFRTKDQLFFMMMESSTFLWILNDWTCSVHAEKTTERSICLILTRSKIFSANLLVFSKDLFSSTTKFTKIAKYFTEMSLQLDKVKCHHLRHCNLECFFFWKTGFENMFLPFSWFIKMFFPIIKLLSFIWM